MNENVERWTDANTFGNQQKKGIHPLNHRVSNPFKFNACSVKSPRNMKAPSPRRLLHVASSSLGLHRRLPLLEPSLIFCEMKVLPHLNSLQLTLGADQLLFDDQSFLVLSLVMLENFPILLTSPLNHGICFSEVFLKTCYDEIFFGIGWAKLFDLLILACGLRY